MHLYLEGAGISRLLLRNLPEHHASVAQPLKLVGLVDLSEQVGLVVFVLTFHSLQALLPRITPTQSCRASMWRILLRLTVPFP